MHTLVTALLSDLRSRGVALVHNARADSAARTPDGWRVTAGPTAYDAGLLVVALDGPAAVGLLETAVPMSGLSPWWWMSPNWTGGRGGRASWWHRRPRALKPRH